MKPWFIRVVLLAVFLAGMYLPVSGSAPEDVCTWSGVADSNWHNAANWMCGHLPGPNDTVDIPVIPVGNHYPYLGFPGTAGTVTVNAGATLGLNPDTSLTVANGLTLNQAAELRPGLNSTITLQNGNWTDNGAGVLSDGPWTLGLDGLGDQAITGAKPTQSFGNLTLRNMNMGLPLFNVGANVNQLNIGGTLTLGGDTTFDAGTAGVDVRGNWLNNGGSFQGSGVVTFGGGDDQLIGGSAPVHTFPGPVKVNKSAGKVSLGNGTDQLIFNGPLDILGGTLRLGGKQLTTNDTTTIGPGTLDLGVGGMWTANKTIVLAPGGTFAPGTGTVTLNEGNWTNNQGTVDYTGLWALRFNSSGNQWINGTATTQSFSNVTLSNPGMGMPDVQVGGSTTRLNLGGTLTLGPDTTFRPGTATAVQIEGDWLNNGGLLVGGSGNDVLFGGSNPQTIGGTATSQTFPGDLTVNKPALGVTLGGSTALLTVNGQFNVTGGAFNLGSGTLTTGGPAMLRSGGKLNLGSGAWNSNACLYLETGGTLNPGSGTLNFRGGTFGFYGGTVETGNWAANFLMRGNQNVGGMGTATFHNVGVFNDTMGGPATLSIGSAGRGPTTLFLSGNLTIGDGATFDPGTANGVYYAGNQWRNDGDFLPGGGTTTFMGSGPRLRELGALAAQVITGTRPTTFNNLTIDNPSGVTLGSSQRVSGTLDLRGGDLTTAAYTLTLGSAATVTGTHDVIGAVQRTQTFSAGVPYSFGQSNVRITFADPGDLTSIAVRMQQTTPAGLTPAVARTYTIMPAGGGYNATLRLSYQDAELNGIAKARLRLWRRGAEQWETHGPQTPNPAENWVEQSGVTAFSEWTLASENAGQGSRIYLPIVLR